MSEQLMYQIAIQLGIGGLTIYLFYKYAMMVTNKSMNGITKKIDKMLEKQDKLIDKIDSVIDRIDKLVLIRDIEEFKKIRVEEVKNE